MDKEPKPQPVTEEYSASIKEVTGYHQHSMKPKPKDPGQENQDD